jgi:four helix bundle protein
MPGVQRFEDLEAWKTAHSLASEVYALTSRPPLSTDFGLRDQLRRAAVSVTSNIAEGFERRGDREFRNFLTIAKGSVAEIRSQLMIARDLDWITADQFDKPNTLALSTARLLSGLIRYFSTSTHVAPTRRP